MYNAYLIYLAVIQDFFKQTFAFKGTTSRRDFWLVMLFNLVSTLIVSILASILISNVPNVHYANYISLGYELLLLIPSLSLLVRRIRDTGLSLWWLAIYILPIIGIVVLIVLTLLPSKRCAPRF
jgi:uncharacterized membrane protein YhaH (DUF805 family)